MMETPSISNACYSSVANSAGSFGSPLPTSNLVRASQTFNADNFAQLASTSFDGWAQQKRAEIESRLAAKPIQQQQQEEKQEMAKRRLVQIFIADPNENVPLDQAVLYRGEQKLTDLTDQELFFEIDIKSILEAHNEKRVKIADRKVKERVEHLEPIKVRDLRMVVVTVAEF